jgi:hypothetical protein
MKAFSKIEVYCAVVLLVLFFLPWIQITAGEVVSVSFTLRGYEIPDLADHVAKGLGQVKSFFDENAKRETWVFWYYLIYLLPVFSVATVVLGILGKNVKVTGLLTAAVPIGWFIYALIKIGGDLFGMMTLGAYGTLLCAILMILAVVEVLRIPGAKRAD